MPEPHPPIKMLDLDAQRRAIGATMDARISRVLDHGKYILGPEVEELERELAERSGVGHVVTCGNGTDALQLALMAWGVGPGDAVFVPSFTFTATAEVVALLGATPVFCDVSPDSYNIDVMSLATAVETVLSSGTLVPKAVIPVDLFGLPADYPAVNEIAVRYGLHVLADAAQSYGATQNGIAVGALAEATATSFFPAKPLGCYGDGGAVFTDDTDLAELLRSIRVHGKGSDKYDTVRIGVNSRLDTLQAAILLAKLTVFDAELEARQSLAAGYSEALKASSGLVIPSPEPSAWAQYTIAVDRSKRDGLIQHLKEDGIPTAIYYPRALHDQPAYSSLEATSAQIPNVSTRLAGSVLSLPMHPYLDDCSANRVITTVQDAFAALG